MKFQLNRSNPKQKIIVPNTAVKLSSLGAETELELNALKGAIVVTKSKMTAMDVINTIWSLSGIVAEMIAVISSNCDSCDECGYCDHLCDTDSIHLPDAVLEAAGIPPGYKLAADVDDNGTITVRPALHDYDLSDVPQDLLKIFRHEQVCIRELEELLKDDDVICNGGDENKGDDL